MNHKLNAIVGQTLLILLSMLLTIQNVWYKYPAHEVINPSPKIKRSQLELDTRKEIGLGPHSIPSEWFYQQRAYPHGKLDETSYYSAFQNANQQELLARDEIDELWSLAGPLNTGGRITGIAINQVTQEVYAGGAFSGVWKSNGNWQNPQWSQIFENAGSLSIGAIAVAPSSPDTIYVGTGEANSAGATYPGDGLWFSPNGGLTWEQRGLDSSFYIGKIVVHPTNPSVVYVAALGKRYSPNPDRGLYKSTNAGLSWSRVLFSNDTTGAIDIAINPLQPDTIYCAMWQRIRYPSHSVFYGRGSTIMRSTNGGDTWTEVLPMALRNQEWCRTGVAVSPAMTNRIYCSVIGTNLQLHSVWRSDDNGNSWVDLSDNIDLSICSNFGWYFNIISCPPTNANHVYIHGVQLAFSTTAGVSWSYVPNEQFSNVHVDFHAQEYIQGTTRQVWGNDGGIYFIESMSPQSTPRHIQSLPLTQFYAISYDVNFPNRLLGGTQDNGTVYTSTGQLTDWVRILGGDGFYCLVDPRYSDSVYAEWQFGNLTKGTGSNRRMVLSGINAADRRNWSTPVAMDPQRPDVLYYGTYRIYKTFNAANQWSVSSPDLTGGEINSRYPTISTISVSTLDTNVVWTGTENGFVWLSTNSGNTWSNVSNGLPNRYVTRVYASTDSSSKAYVTLSGFRWDETIGHVYVTNDFGLNWYPIANDLPNVPVNVIVSDPLQPNHLYVGNDVGVYYSINHGLNWQRLSANHPPSTVIDMFLHPVSRKLVTGTHGYSMWSFPIDSIQTFVENRKDTQTPTSIRLGLPYPNPFNAETVVKLDVEVPQMLKVMIVDVLGRVVNTVQHKKFEVGQHQIRWSAKQVPSGMYWMKIESETSTLFRKLLVLK